MDGSRSRPLHDAGQELDAGAVDTRPHRLPERDRRRGVEQPALVLQRLVGVLERDCPDHVPAVAREEGHGPRILENVPECAPRELLARAVFLRLAARLAVHERRAFEGAPVPALLVPDGDAAGPDFRGLGHAGTSTGSDSVSAGGPDAITDEPSRAYPSALRTSSGVSHPARIPLSYAV